jgi:hypothetical protein
MAGCSSLGSILRYANCLKHVTKGTIGKERTCLDKD